MKKYVILVLVLILTEPLVGQRAKQSLKHLSDDAFDLVKEDLARSIKKDSLNPLNYYIKGLLYISDSFPERDIESAHWSILMCQQLLERIAKKQLREMEKVHIYREDFNTLKFKIDDLAFDMAKSQNTISSYNQYIESYEDSHWVIQAAEFRNQLAFENAEAKNTWQAYKTFFEKYPDAQQFKRAKKMFNELLFIEQMLSNKVEDWENFLVTNPNTPHRKEVEARIFDELIANWKPDPIYRFINTYHNPSLTKKGLDILYYLDGLNKEKLKDFNHPIYRVHMDSIQRIERLNVEVLLPLYSDGSYQFINVNGQLFMQERFENISQKYFCGNMTSELMIVSRRQKQQIINREGIAIYEGEIDHLDDLGMGILAIYQSNGVGIIHKSGFEILSVDYEEIKMLNNELFAFRQNGKMGLKNFSGKTIIKPWYDDIQFQGSFYIFEKESAFAISNFSQLISDTPRLTFLYEEFELVNPQYILGYTADNEVLFDDQFEKVSPATATSIITRYETWVMKLKEGYQLFDSKKQTLSPYIYSEVVQNDEWMGLKRNGHWSVYQRNMSDNPILDLDSVNMVGNDLAIFFSGKVGYAVFPNKKSISIEFGQKVKSLNAQSQSGAHFLVVSKGGNKILYKDAVQLFESDYDEISYISDDYFKVKKGGYFGAVNAKGQLVMKVRYDAIAEAKDGISNLLFKGKFGAFNFNEKILLDTDYDEKFVSYNSHMFIVKSNGNYGLIDDKNNIVVATEFEAIDYWTDSTFLAKEDGEWSILKISNLQEIFSGILTYELIKNMANEKVLKVQGEKGVGIYHAKLGQIVPMIYNYITNLGNQDQPVYFAEISFPEAEHYLTVHYDKTGKKIRTAAYRLEEYEKIVCEE